ncbi:hypothetical protein DRN34_05435 [Thermococci archaeon]|nr:MAG: hypothetical protein DRN34_05435 [Thermococci archaeon]
MTNFITIPYDGVIMVRISDNVLSDEDWPVIKFTFTGGKITGQEVMKDGVYAVEDLVGLDRVDFLGWLTEDTTGQHPEIYHEIVT